MYKLYIQDNSIQYLGFCISYDVSNKKEKKRNRYRRNNWQKSYHPLLQQLEQLTGRSICDARTVKMENKKRRNADSGVAIKQNTRQSELKETTVLGLTIVSSPFRDSFSMRLTLIMRDACFRLSWHNSQPAASVFGREAHRLLIDESDIVKSPLIV